MGSGGNREIQCGNELKRIGGGGSNRCRAAVMSRDRIGGLRESMWMGGADTSLIKGLGYEEHIHIEY